MLRNALVVAATVTLALAIVAVYARIAYVDSDEFANRAAAALREDAVRTLVAERVTDDIVLDREQDLIAARPLIEGVVSGVVGSRAFGDLFRAGVRDVHRALVHGRQDTVTLTVADVGAVAAAALDAFKPGIARRVRATGKVTLLEDDLGSIGGTLSAAARRAEVLSVLLSVLWLLLTVAAIVVSRERHRTVAALGVGAAVAGVVLVVAWRVGRTVAVHQVSGPEAQAAAGAVWDAFLGGLRTLAWIVAGIGAIVAASATAVIRPGGLPLREIAERVVREPRRPALKAVRGVALIAAGVVVVLQPSAAVAALATATGVLLIYTGAVALLRLAAPPEPAHVERPRRRHRLWLGVAALVVVAVAVAALAGGGAVTTAAPRSVGCNGHRELCGRPLRDVALAATHNAMSVPLPGWFSSLQERPIPDQLRDGIRGLLIDTHYGDLLPNGRVRTATSSLEDLKRSARKDGVSEDAIRAALRIRDRLGFRGEGKRGMYLCHAFCELGATPLEQVLRQLRDFMVANPGAVVVLINQDEVRPADFVKAMDDAGLGKLAYAGPLGAGAPTLGRMVAGDHRLVVLAEKHGGAAPWYRTGYESDLQETPFTFANERRLEAPASCRPNRGPAGAPLFLLNHWINTDPLPRPSLAARVNARGPLLRRARECERIRGRLPNLIAVDFYRRGDVLGVVDALNGLKN